MESEQQEARTMHSRFPEPLKSAVLKAVQWRELYLPYLTFVLLITVSPNIRLLEVMGRLDHLVEAVYERFKDRYYPDESESCSSPSASVF